jgi:hypothetical protein
MRQSYKQHSLAKRCLGKLLLSKESQRISVSTSLLSKASLCIHYTRHLQFGQGCVTSSLCHDVLLDKNEGVRYGR